jgi:hypothetical protein
MKKLAAPPTRSILPIFKNDPSRSQPIADGIGSGKIARRTCGIACRNFCINGGII